MLDPLFAGVACAAQSGDGPLESLAQAKGWLNSRPLSAAELRGKPVLVQFWTFTCINWLRTLPYIRAWAERYRESGLVVIGAHAPEFPFEHSVDNVRREARRLNVSYPVAIDSDFAIWRAFGNQYWPALYLIDANGSVRQHWFGEGEYTEIERAIQQLLLDSGASHVERQIAPVVGRGIEAAADWGDLRTPETYLGYEQATSFASPGGAARDKARAYALPSELGSNEWALAGDWTIQKGNIALNQPGGRIAFRFHGRDLHLVMGTPSSNSAVNFRVLLDGQPPGASHGGDIDEHGAGVAKEQRLYQLIRQPPPIVDRVFQIEFLDPGVEAFVFTFG